WGDIMSDDAIKGGSGDNDVNELLQLESFTGKSNTTLLESGGVPITKASTAPM
ncbi:MAG: hypothetical protein IPH94_16015, partial [Saprospiraceae bacterium]|nr:hypothetical protein [Saprospiraceae bacterium]